MDSPGRLARPVRGSPIVRSVSARLRLTELQLLLIPSLVVLIGVLLGALARSGSLSISWMTIWLALAFLGLLWGGHFILVAFRPDSDQTLLPIAGTLAALGLIMAYRLEPSLVAVYGDVYSGLASRQLLWIGLGWLVMVAVVCFLRDLSFLQRYRYTLLVFGLLLVASTFVLGTGPNGVRLWLEFGPLRFQPSEGLKVIIAVYLAAYLYDRKELLSVDYHIGRFRFFPLPYLLPLLVMLCLSLLLFSVQRDLGGALLFFGIFLVMLYVASGRSLYVWFGGLLFLLGAALMYRVMEKVQLRVDLWLNPWDRLQEGYQIIQSIFALAGGGILGTGIGFGRPYNIPAVHTDMIFAAIGEELGLAGSLAVLALYMMLVFRIYFIALRTNRGFQQLLAIGLGTTLGLQALIIIAGTIKLLPLTGITLPFISYGGSSILVNFFIIGLLLSISSGAKEARRR